jgi:hypothetical protein
VEAFKDSCDECRIVVKQALLIKAHAFISNSQNLSTSPRSSVFMPDVLDIRSGKMIALFDAIDQDKMRKKSD